MEFFDLQQRYLVRGKNANGEEEGGRRVYGDSEIRTPDTNHGYKDNGSDFGVSEKNNEGSCRERRARPGYQMHSLVVGYN